MLLVPISWTERVWALPVLTALVPSERYNAAKGRRHKTLLDFDRQLALQARRWLSGRALVLGLMEWTAPAPSVAAVEWLAAHAIRSRFDVCSHHRSRSRQAGFQVYGVDNACWPVLNPLYSLCKGRAGACLT